MKYITTSNADKLLQEISKLVTCEHCDYDHWELADEINCKLQNDQESGIFFEINPDFTRTGLPVVVDISSYLTEDKDELPVNKMINSLIGGR